MKTLLLALFLALAGPALAADTYSLCFTESTAKKLAADLQVCATLEEKLSLCDSRLKLSDRAKASYQSRVLELENSVEFRDMELDKLGRILKEKQEDLEDCNGSKPSRLAWFGGGVLATLLTALLAGLAFK